MSTLDRPRTPVKRTPWARDLRKWRRDQDVTQVVLAARLGISIAWLSHLETGYRRPTAELVEKLREAGFASQLEVRFPVVAAVSEVAVPEVRTVTRYEPAVDPDDVPLGAWS